MFAARITLAHFSVSSAQNRVFIHFHGGACVLNPGEPGTWVAGGLQAYSNDKRASGRVVPRDPVA
jgi:hypothetical protein